ncbi:MAG TPA: hypothetical protein DCY13_08070, partial [Verrucomicrobiales bacterium]|nr:hypothetical protein [Verrucomicrobiales bacterium]
MYPLTIALISALVPAGEEAAALSPHPGMLALIFVEIMISFGIFFGIAWAASRVSFSQLMMKWRKGWLPWVLGFGYSLAMRLIVGVIVYAVLTITVVVMLASQGGTFTTESVQEIFRELVEKFRPRVEHVVDTRAIVDSPLYLFLNVTLVSFVMAGFR